MNVCSKLSAAVRILQSKINRLNTQSTQSEGKREREREENTLANSSCGLQKEKRKTSRNKRTRTCFTEFKQFNKVFITTFHVVGARGAVMNCPFAGMYIGCPQGSVRMREHYTFSDNG